MNVDVGLVPPGEKVEQPIGDLGSQDTSVRPLTVYFQDTRGRCWQRDEAGHLHRRPERVPPRSVQPRARRAPDGSVVHET